MTVASNVKHTLANLKGVEADLSRLALQTEDHESKRSLHETMMLIHEIVMDLKKRVNEIEREEVQYRGF
ncbi:DUF1657 domain-containing protein [Bacillus marasmi]|uniref:DUF1657 domain-containing protein n=1 Tax=Bacillus marasmi TaxID=1926279 RepID=UPI0011C8FE25|nr:DUF1657 domain-containing protein [Bacillus marasmi]